MSSAVSADMLDTAKFRRVLNFTASGYDGSETLENFPALVRFSEESVTGFRYAELGGTTNEVYAALRFADASGRNLDYEIDIWDTNGLSAVWVSLPELSGRTTKFKAYWSAVQSYALPAVHPTNVWTSAGYVGVWHFSHRGGSTASTAYYSDSTGRGSDIMSPDEGATWWLASPRVDASCNANGTPWYSNGARGNAINTGDWKWELGATMGHYKNEITALPGNRNSYTTDLYGATILTKEGLAAGTFYGYKTNGVFATTSEAEAAGIFQLTTTGQQQYFSAGDMKFVDQNGDKCISEADMTIIGDPNPDFYGNITSSLSYKRLRLDLVFNYSVGGDIYNYQRSLLEGGSYFYNQTTAMLHRWQYEGQQTDIPRASYLDTMGNSRFSDRWIEDGSYLKLKNVTLSYNIPVRSTYLQAITLWGSANNLFTITKYLGSDPEFSMTNSVLGMGIDRGLHAPGRSFSLGVKINL